MDDPPCLTIEQWSAALHLATMWHFDAAKKYMIEAIKSQHTDQSPFDRLRLARKCLVGQWIHPVYLSLCNRDEPLTAEEGEELGYRCLMAICRLRESRHNGSTSHERKGCKTCYDCSMGYRVGNCSRPHLPLAAVVAEEDLAVPFEVDAV